ncbi:DUF2637 domain-containing protein [Streptomyces sp. NPDC048269]|uniref:DUF2637 domain-containing protein n=1 Tax=Streptomyces sp. NPDC048269 TaxID=3155753 RepID=UPI0034258BBC
MQLTRTHRILIGVVVAGAVVIAAIGFAGSYSAVRALALQKGFGDFSLVFPIGIDAGICVLLALDLLLTWIRIPFPLLRQTAWLLTIATIAFNGAAAWPDPLGVGMHAVIPILFVVTVEAARHAVGRIADITADRHMEGVRITRWLLSPVPTFKLWRRMKLWELRSYEQAVGMEQDRLIYQARLQARYGRFWRRKAPVEALMPLKLSRIGVPLAQTAPKGLAAAGIDSALLPPAAPVVSLDREPVEELDTGAAPQTVQALAALGPSGPEGAESSRGPGQAVRTSDRSAQGLTDEELWEAYRSYSAGLGEFADAASFAWHLAEAYGVTDPKTGGPMSRADLEPTLARLHAGAHPLTGHRVEPAVTDDDPLVTARTARPVSGPPVSPSPPGIGETATTTGPPVLAPHVPTEVALEGREPARALTAAAADDRRADGGGPGQTSRAGLLPIQPADPASGQTNVWESTGGADSGAATARLPRQQATDESELDPVQSQVVTVSGWLAEAEEAGQKLSGAEVGRRLGVSPKTGQRRLLAATAHLAEQRRQQDRPRLRAVRG